jgi:hypothetical protein
MGVPQSKSKYNKRVSTALLYCGTTEGFVIGADSRAFNKITKQVETDKERKILPLLLHRKRRTDFLDVLI